MNLKLNDISHPGCFALWTISARSTMNISPHLSLEAALETALYSAIVLGADRYWIQDCNSSFRLGAHDIETRWRLIGWVN